jgi:hypothetical protein
MYLMSRASNPPVPFTPLQKLGIVAVAGVLLVGGWFVISGRAATSLGLTLTSNPDLERGLIAHYTFDGDNLDLSANTAEVRNRVSASYFGNWLNHGTTTTQGPVGQAVRFDGTNDSVSVGNTGQTVKTVSFWVKAGATTEQPYVALNGTTAKVGLQDGNIEFGTGGVVTSTPGSVAQGVTSDGTYLYVVGTDDSSNWRVEKRAMSDGATTTTTGFGTNGAVTSTPGFDAYAIVNDGTYLYVGGDDNSAHWRIEKRAMSNGATTTTTGFGTNGAVTNVNAQIAGVLNHDGTYLYVGGPDANDYWYVEKRAMSDGATTTTTGFGANGSVTSTGGLYLYNIQYDGTYLYLTGEDGSSNWRIEKRAMSDGSFDSGFGTAGAVTSTPGDFAYSATNDGTHLYVAGEDNATNWRIEKRAMSDGATTTTTGFGTNGAVTSRPGYTARSIIDDGTYLYVIGDTTLTGGDWRIEKRTMSDGATTTTTGFGTNGAVTSSGGSIPHGLVEDGTYLYVVGVDDGNNWRIEKRRISDGSLADGTGGATPVVTATGFTAPTVYVDGVQTTTLPDSGWHHITITDTTGVLASNTILGSDGTSYLNGSLDDVRLYDRALSAEEAKRVYQLGATTRVGMTLTSSDSLEEGLVTHYTFDGKDFDWSALRQLRDRTGLGSDCYLDPSAEHGTSTVPGVIGQAYRFSSSTITDDDDMFVCNQTPITALQFGASTDFTIAFWLNGIVNDPSWFTIQNYGWGSAEGGWRIQITSSGRLLVNLDDGTTDVLSTDDALRMRSNQWYHVVITFDRDGNMTRYIDAVQSGTADSIATVGDVTPPVVNTMTLSTGSNGNPGDYTMDDFRIYNRLLTQEEIARLYGLGNTTRVGATVVTNPKLEEGLVGHWTFDGEQINYSLGTAELRDRSPYGHHGNWVSHASTTAPGAIGRGIYLDSTGYGRITATTDLSPTAITYAAWVKRRGTQEFYAKIIYETWNNNSGPTFGSGLVLNQLEVDSSMAALVIGIAGAQHRLYSYPGMVPDETWTHIVGTYDPSASAPQMNLYINGTLASSTTATGAIAYDTTGADDDVLIGSAYFASASQAFVGVVDDVRMYNRALSPAEVRRLYELGD